MDSQLSDHAAGMMCLCRHYQALVAKFGGVPDPQCQLKLATAKQELLREFAKLNELRRLQKAIDAMREDRDRLR